MRPTKMEAGILHYLVENGFITQEQGDAVQKQLGAGSVSSLREALVGKELLKGSTLATVIASYLGVTIVSLSSRTPESRALACISTEQARELRVLPLSIERGGTILLVAMEVSEPDIIKKLEKLTSMWIRSCVLSEGGISKETLERYYPMT